MKDFALSWPLEEELRKVLLKFDDHDGYDDHDHDDYDHDDDDV